MKNWNNIGAVIVYSDGPNPKWYPSLKDALISLNMGYRIYWEKVPLVDKINKYGRLGEGWLIAGDRYLIKDDLGLIIPHWKIVDTFNNISCDDLEGWRNWYRRHRPFKFRNGPVPNIRCWHAGSRAPRKLWQAFRVDHIDKNDEDLKEYKFKRKNHVERFARFRDWDDDHFDWRDRNWKRHRKHQWKE